MFKQLRQVKFVRTFVRQVAIAFLTMGITLLTIYQAHLPEYLLVFVPVLFGLLNNTIKWINTEQLEDL